MRRHCDGCGEMAIVTDSRCQACWAHLHEEQDPQSFPGESQALPEEELATYGDDLVAAMAGEP